MSLLPTPPRSSQKDKENRPPTPVTPANSQQRVLRIAWSQENLHHTYSTEIRTLPSSSSLKGPNKPILKKVDVPLMDLSSPCQRSRYITPEPADPLHQADYLRSPISTLLASLKPENISSITLIDLVEAYTELLRRLKSRGPSLFELYGPIPALNILRENSEPLARAFRRDIERALTDPQAAFNSNELLSSEDLPWSSPSSMGSIKKRGFTEQEIKYARDLCSLCHSALRCFSTFAVVPALFSVFSDEQLADILTGILAIPLSSPLPTPNARKTCQIAIWALQVQRLPSIILAPAADRITYAIRRGIDGELGREGKNGAASDGFKAIAMLAEHKPEIFLAPFAELLPSVLTALVSSNLALRLEAANTLLGLASALSTYPNPPPALLASFSLAIGTYLSDQHQARKPGQDLSPIGKIFRTCLNVEVPAHSAQSPMWALSCISAFIVLSRGDALSQPRTIKFILTHLQTAMAAKRTTVRATAGLVWRSLVWACLHLDGSGEEGEEKKSSAWKVVRQLVDGAIGISVVAALVGHSNIKSKRLAEAIEVIRAMIKRGGKTCEEAVDVLERLLCGIGHMAPVERKWDENSLLAEPIFDGTLLRADWKTLTGHVKSGLNKSAAIQDITPLQESEVCEHWQDLFKLWKEALAKAPLEENGDVPSPLLNSWEALLIVQAQTNRGFDEMIGNDAFPAELVQLLASFFTDASLEWSLGPTAPAWSPQPLKLGFVRNLWVVVKKIFPTSLLHTASDLLLNELITTSFSLRQPEVLKAWSQLYVELALSMSADQLRTIWESQICSCQDIDHQDLWRTLSKAWLLNPSHYSRTLELICSLLDFPSEITFTTDDSDIWSGLVKHAIVSASVCKVEPQMVLESIANRVGFSRHTTAICAVLPPLLSILCTVPSEGTSLLPQTLLKLSNDVLVAAYPPADSETKVIVFSLLHFLGRVVEGLSTEQRVEALSLVQEGIVVWLEDKVEEFSDDELNQEVIPVYGNCLKALADVPPSTIVLSQLLPFFLSAFNRIPKPATGPSMFKSFWARTYQKNQSIVEYPEPLKPILRTIQDIMCEPEEVLAPGISQTTEIRSQETDVASDVTASTLNNDGEIGVASYCDPEEGSGEICQTGISMGPAKVLQAPASVKEEPSQHQLPHVFTPVQSTSPRKRRKSFGALSKKKRKTESSVKSNMEIINISDDDDGDSVIEDSIIVVRTPLRNKRPHNDGEGQDNGDLEEVQKRQKMNRQSSLNAQRDETPQRIKKDVDRYIHSEEGNFRDSDSSVPSSHLGRLSTRYVFSPRLQKSRSEPLDIGSDDVSMSSSPLKSIMTRRQLRRSTTAPTLLLTSKESADDNLLTSASGQPSRSPSEGLIALEHAHDAIIKGDVEEMGIEELLKASKMLNGISMALNERMSKKLASSP
ncbi:hypothetical protein Clacol_004737 [Clathrus columnatus]|uniref:Telomere-associated protein Rif1 N-terminal domain-containing protein n=1 Tax=Clathrus columnatus TaxID=1419009 RepID=A0AAV5ABW2_9AGAM|nr:hypothetical protein Clacol_004737 [Clathrus columnatus]